MFKKKPKLQAKTWKDARIIMYETITVQKLFYGSKSWLLTKNWKDKCRHWN